MSTGTLDPMGRLALRPCTPANWHRTAWGTGSMALAVAQSLGLLMLFALGALPYLLHRLIATRLRPKRL